MWAEYKLKTGFTIVELLIVIVVIGILAAVTIIAYNGVQSRAQSAKIQTDIATMVRAVTAARNNESKTLGAITGSYGTGSSCWSKVSGTNLATLPQTDACWTSYNLTLANITSKSGIDITNMVDPWGRPYLIDENEGESGGCLKDTIAVYKQPFTNGFGTYSSTTIQNVPNSGFSGCTPG